MQYRTFKPASQSDNRLRRVRRPRPRAAVPSRPKLRDDVERLVVGYAAATNVRRPWATYERFKSALSHACGWDAPSSQFDQRLYEMGVAAFVEEAGL